MPKPPPKLPESRPSSSVTYGSGWSKARSPMNSIAGINIAPDGRVAAIIPTPIAATPAQPLGENDNMMSLIATALLAGQTAPAPPAAPAPAAPAAAPAAAGKFTL